MAVFEIYEDTKHLYRWRLVADNGRIMADSAEGYNSLPNVRRALTRIKAVSPEAEIVEGDNGRN